MTKPPNFQNSPKISEDQVHQRAQRFEVNEDCQITGVHSRCTLLNLSQSGALVAIESIPESVLLKRDAELVFKNLRILGTLIRLDRHKVGIQFQSHPKELADVLSSLRHP